MQPICLKIIQNNYTLQEALTVIYDTLNKQRLSKEERGDLGELAVLYTLLAIQQRYPKYVTIYHSALFKKPKSDWTTELDFIVVTPFAVFVIETKSFYGHTKVLQNQKLEVTNKYGKKEYDVIYQNQGHCRTLYELIYSYVKSPTVIIPIVTLFSVGTLEDTRTNDLRNKYPVLNVNYLATYIGTILNKGFAQSIKPTVNLPKCIQQISSNNIQSKENMIEHIQRIKKRY